MRKVRVFLSPLVRLSELEASKMHIGSFIFPKGFVYRILWQKADICKSLSIKFNYYYGN